MTAVICCPRTQACYVDAAFAYVSGCDLAIAEECRISIKGCDWIVHCTHGDKVAVYTDFDDIEPIYWTLGGYIKMMPIRREPKETRTSQVRPRVRGKVRRAA